MRVGFFDHAGKGLAYAEALIAAGHDIVDIADPAARGADVLLLDSDRNAALMALGLPVVLYPHGGNVVAWWDGAPPHPSVRAILVPAYGHAQVLALHGVRVPVVPVGWSYCPLRHPRQDPLMTSRRNVVVFGPSHALDNGRIDPSVVAANERILADLRALPNYSVRVRSYEDRLGLSYSDLDDAAVVVADGTLLALAVARGVPAVSFAQDVTPDNADEGEPLPAPTWANWRRRVRFPVDADDGPIVRSLAAARYDTDTAAAVAAWREAFIGCPFDTDLAVALVEAAACV